MSKGILADPFAQAAGPDLAALVETQNSPLAEWTEITGLPSPVRRRSAYRLEFADGARRKGRRLKSPERAASVARLRERIGPGYARILDRRGDALLLEWVEGRSLTLLHPIPAQVLRYCGGLLGTLHRADAGDETLATTVVDVMAKLERHAEVLKQSGALEPDLIRRAVELTLENPPDKPESGIIHKDFCAENIVIDATGAPVCIDNAKLSVGPVDLDLAMTWYRWPMSSSERAQFASGYEEHRSMKRFLEHFSFWAPCVLLGSASTRLRARTGRVDVPIERLRRLLEFLESPRGGEEHPFWQI